MSALLWIYAGGVIRDMTVSIMVFKGDDWKYGRSESFAAAIISALAWPVLLLRVLKR